MENVCLKYTEFVQNANKNLADGKPFDLKLIDYITYNPNYDEHGLELLIERASENGVQYQI